jgi:putative DNA primase/helicase
MDAPMENVAPINVVSKRIRELDHKLRTAFGADKKLEALFEIVVAIETGFADESNKSTAVDFYHNRCRDMYELDLEQIEHVIGEAKAEARGRAQQPKPELTPPPRAKSRGLLCVRASEVEPKKYEWVWRGRIARGKHTTIAGDPGLGKSQIAISIAAAVTNGGHWPCDEGRAPVGNVIILSAEDGIEDTVIPRLIAAGANRDRVHIVKATLERGKARAFDLQADLDLLEEKIRDVGDMALVIVDPISAYLGGKVDSHKNAETRAVLTPFGELADRTNVAVLSVTHLNKASAGQSVKALYRVIGTIPFTAAPRAVFLVTEDPDDASRCLLLQGKNNIAAPQQGLALRKLQTMVGAGGDILASHIGWEPHPVSNTADETIGGSGGGGGDAATAKEDAAEFLKAVLLAGPMAVPVLEKEARGAGYLRDDQPISQSKPFRSARKLLGITPYQPKGVRAGGWVWALPAHQMPSDPSDALSK